MGYTILLNPVENARPWRLCVVGRGSSLGAQLLLYTVRLPATARTVQLTAADRTADDETRNSCLEASVILVYVKKRPQVIEKSSFLFSSALSNLHACTNKRNPTTRERQKGSPTIYAIGIWLYPAIIYVNTETGKVSDGEKKKKKGASSNSDIEITYGYILHGGLS